MLSKIGKLLEDREVMRRIKNHQVWLEEQYCGTTRAGERLDLSGCIIPNMDFTGMDLRQGVFIDTLFDHVVFDHTNLRRSNFTNATLLNCQGRFAGFDRIQAEGVTFYKCDFEESGFMASTMENAVIRSSSFIFCNISRAWLCGAKVCDCDFNSSHFTETRLEDSIFNNIDFSGTSFTGAKLSGAVLTQIHINYLTSGYELQCPAHGSFTAYKKAKNHLVRLYIHTDSLRSSATTRKCRTNKATVLEIVDANGRSVPSVPSDYDPNFVYEVGKDMEVLDFETDRWQECAAGIHFFMSKEEAWNY